MKTKATLIATSAAVSLALTASSALAGDMPNGPHYNLNIIGVEKAKKANMTDSQRHTIFVPLYSKKTGKNSTDGTALVDSKIWLTPGYKFEVCDGNGFDLAYGCDIADYPFDVTWNGTVILDDGSEVVVADRKEGAVFALPCNTNITGLADTDGDGDKDDEVELISCNETVDTTTGNIVPVDETDIVPTMNYEVWIRALGNGGDATVTTCATVQDDVTCSSENVLAVAPKGRNGTPPTFSEVTDELTSTVVNYCFEYDLEGDCIDLRETRVALFAGDTEDWFWNYDNNGLRLAQLRFYEVPAAE